MQTENVLIARICHDLITPCNAINLGLEAYEMSEDKGLLSCIKDSATKANVLLKFMRELFMKKDDNYLYSVEFLRSLVAEFLEVYNIGSDFITDCDNFNCSLGRIILCNGAIMKELMPMGGKAIFKISNDCIEIICSGNGVIALDTSIPQELTYKNVLQFKLLEQLKNNGFSVVSSLEHGEGKIIESCESS